MPSNWHKGNAEADGAEYRGWLVGHFVGDSGDIRATKDVEIKWGIHPAGDERQEWSTDEYRTTVVLLVRGRFHLNLPTGSVLLAEEGDYLMWGSRRGPFMGRRGGLDRSHDPLALDALS